MRYVVAIGNFLFHIELYYCNRLNLYFTSNFVDIIEVSNWVTGEIDTIFFFINFLSLTHVYPFFFSLISIFLSHHTCLPFFSYLNFSGYICLFRFIRCGMLTASFVHVSFFYWWKCWVEFVILKYSILSPTCESLCPKRDERKK